jgi:hypothetical protein
MYGQYQDRVDFLTLYIREAHPTDEWQMDVNEKESVCYPQAHSTSERAATARDFVQRFHYPIPLLVDPIENLADNLYAGWPERLYIVDETGRIAYKGKTGPFGFEPNEVERWLKAKLARN